MPESFKSWEDVELLSRGKTKILVVDDEEPITEIMAARLTSEGYFVETATSVERMDSLHVNLVLQY